jgi:hypothetical protein
VKYRRWLPNFDPNLRTTVNISESYEGHTLQVSVARSGLATTSCAVYINGKQAAYDIVPGSEPEILVVGITKAMGLIDRLTAESSPSSTGDQA